MPYQRKTEDEYQIHQYHLGHWEEVHCESTRRAVVQSLKNYRKNQPQYPVKIVKKRVPICQT